MTGPNDPAGAETVESTVRRRIVWGYVGGAALIVVAVLLAWWAIANGAAPEAPAAATSASPTASSSPAGSDAASSALPSGPASSPTGPPADGDAPGSVGAPGPAESTAPVIAAFAVSTTVAECADDRSATVPLAFTWTATGADEAWIGVGTTDASVVPSAAVPLSSDGYTELAFACGDEEQLYTLTVRGASGTTSSSVLVTRSLL
ncbi:hypothetical protein [Microbacterium sp. A1-JK]|uniref:hypothetical protein n=1 Tax=Microbacterium sp. A1-JK TaxID=3177516 RepID=UPI003887BFDF